MELPEYIGTLSQSIERLYHLGYTQDFNIASEIPLAYLQEGQFSAKYFTIEKTYRFEGSSNPDDQSILYVISSDHFNVKGILVNGYGISANSETELMIAHLIIEHACQSPI